MKVTIKKYGLALESEKFDLLVECLSTLDKRPTYVDFQLQNQPELSLTVKFLLPEEIGELTDFNFLHFENTNLLFYRFTYQWGIIDLKTKQLKRKESDASLDFPFFYLHKNCILIVDDLFAETITLEGNPIDRIANEQPHEIEEFDDYFEFDILGANKRILRKTREKKQ